MSEETVGFIKSGKITKVSQRKTVAKSTDGVEVEQKVEENG